MLIALNSTLRRRRRRLLMAGAALALAAGIWSAHGGMTQEHMGEAVSICLAVAAGTGAALAAGAAIARQRGPFAQVDLCASRTRHQAPPRLAAGWHPARAGPAFLQVLRR